jgi:hypothetical protein
MAPIHTKEVILSLGNASTSPTLIIAASARLVPTQAIPTAHCLKLAYNYRLSHWVLMGTFGLTPVRKGLPGGLEFQKTAQTELNPVPWRRRMAKSRQKALRGPKMAVPGHGNRPLNSNFIVG